MKHVEEFHNEHWLDFMFAQTCGFDRANKHGTDKGFKMWWLMNIKFTRLKLAATWNFHVGHPSPVWTNGI